MEKHLSLWAVCVTLAHFFLPLHLIETVIVDISAFCFLAYVSSDIAKDAKAARKAKREKPAKQPPARRHKEEPKPLAVRRRSK